jgi:hypothetical protein
MFDPSPYLESLETHCDVSHMRDVEALQLASGNYEVVDHCPTIVSCHDTMRHVQYDWPPGWPRFRRSEIMSDAGKMLISELTSAFEGALLKDDRTFTIRADYGQVILPSLLGCTFLQPEDEMPWLHNLSSLDEVNQLLEIGMPDLQLGLGGKVIETEQYFLEMLSAYEKLSQTVHIGSPDTQGPFNLVASIIGSNIYYAVFDHPKLVHQLLQRVTDIYIEFTKLHKRTVGEPMGMCYQMGWVTKGGARIVDDSAVNLSTEMFCEFCVPYNTQISLAFDGFMGHFCGRGRQILHEMLKTPGIHSLNFGNPELQDWNDVYSQALSQQVCLLWDDDIPEKRNQSVTGVIHKRFAHTWKEAEQFAANARSKAT